MKLLALLLASAVCAQDLPQWVITLSKVKRHARANFEKLPNYSCTETIRRTHKRPGDALFQPLDVLTFEVAIVDNKELYMKPGGSRFEPLDLRTASTMGTLGTGSFSATVRNLFVNDNGRVTGWANESVWDEVKLQDRPVNRFDYEISEFMSGFTVHTLAGDATAGISGSYWTDANSLDLVRLDEHATGLPATLGLRSLDSISRFARIKIGNSEPLVAKYAETTIINQDGSQHRNMMEFSGCHEYGSESTIRFGDDPPPPTKKQ